MAEEYARLNYESISNGILRNIVINLKEVQQLQAHDYMIIEDEDYKGKIIDVGCGPGVSSLISKIKNPDLNITLMDGSQLNLELIKTLIIKADIPINNLKLHLGLVGSKMPNKYDTIVMSHVLEHIEDVESTLEWLRSITNPGGTIFIAVPYKDSHWSPNHKHFFSVTENKPKSSGTELPTTDLQKILEDMNFEAEIKIFDMEKVDERQPFKTNGQLDMLIKIKVKK